MTDWNELIDRYLNELRARLQNDSMWRSEKLAQRKFYAYCQERQLVFLSQVRTEHLQSFRAHLVQRLKASTSYAVLSCVRRFLKWATYRGHLMEDPGLGLPARCPHRTSLRPVPTEAQMLALLAAPEQTTPQGMRDLVLFEFLYGTGLRIQECAHVEIADLDLCESLVTVRVAKGGEPRVLPLGPRLKALLSDYLANVRPLLVKNDATGLIVDDRGQTMRTHAIAARVRETSREALKTHFSVHSIRHAFATHLLLGGAPLWAVAKLLGHKRFQTTAIYTRMLALDVKHEVERTHPRAKRKLTKKPSRKTTPPANLES